VEKKTLHNLLATIPQEKEDNKYSLWIAQPSLVGGVS